MKKYLSAIGLSFIICSSSFAVKVGSFQPAKFIVSNDSDYDCTVDITKTENGDFNFKFKQDANGRLYYSSGEITVDSSFAGLANGESLCEGISKLDFNYNIKDFLSMTSEDEPMHERLRQAKKLMENFRDKKMKSLEYEEGKNITYMASDDTEHWSSGDELNMPGVKYIGGSCGGKEAGGISTVFKVYIDKESERVIKFFYQKLVYPNGIVAKHWSKDVHNFGCGSKYSGKGQLIKK